MKVTQIGPDGRLIAKGHFSTLEMQLTNEHPNSVDHGKVRIWQNGEYSATVTKKQAQEILDERAEKGYDDKIKIV